MSLLRIALIWRLPWAVLLGGCTIGVVLALGDANLQLPMGVGPRLVRQAALLLLPLALSVLVMPPVPDYVNQSGAHCGSLSQLHYEESVGTYRALRSARFRDQLMGVLRPWYLPVEAAFRSTSIIVVEAAGRASPMSRRGPALDSRTAPTAQVGGRRGNCLAGGR